MPEEQKGWQFNESTKYLSYPLPSEIKTCLNKNTWPQHTGKDEGLREHVWQPVDLQPIVTKSGTRLASPQLA